MSEHSPGPWTILVIPMPGLRRLGLRPPDRAASRHARCALRPAGSDVPLPAVRRGDRIQGGDGMSAAGSGTIVRRLTGRGRRLNRLAFRIRSGDESAAPEFVRLVRELAQFWDRKRVRPWQDRQDLLAEVVARSWVMARSYRVGHAFSQNVRYAYLGAACDRANYRYRSLFEIGTPAGYHALATLEDFEDPTADIEARDQVEFVLTILKKEVRPEWAGAFLRRWIGGETLLEIGRSMGVTKERARQKIMRAEWELAERLRLRGHEGAFTR